MRLKAGFAPGEPGSYSLIMDTTKIAKLHAAHNRGVVDGLASVFYLSGRGVAAPPLMRRELGSLYGDMRALCRDGSRLVRVVRD